MKYLRNESGIFPIIGVVLIAMSVWLAGYLSGQMALRDDKAETLLMVKNKGD